MKILSICSYGKVRSSVCQKIVGGEILPGGINQASHETIRQYCEQSDIILVMTEIHYWFFKKFFPQFLPKIRTLGIPDLYGGDCDSIILDRLLRESLTRNHIPFLSQNDKSII